MSNTMIKENYNLQQLSLILPSIGVSCNFFQMDSFQVYSFYYFQNPSNGYSSYLHIRGYVHLNILNMDSLIQKKCFLNNPTFGNYSIVGP